MRTFELSADLDEVTADLRRAIRTATGVETVIVLPTWNGCDKVTWDGALNDANLLMPERSMPPEYCAVFNQSCPKAVRCPRLSPQRRGSDVAD